MDTYITIAQRIHWLTGRKRELESKIHNYNNTRKVLLITSALGLLHFSGIATLILVAISILGNRLAKQETMSIAACAFFTISEIIYISWGWSWMLISTGIPHVIAEFMIGLVYTGYTLKTANAQKEHEEILREADYLLNMVSNNDLY